MPANGYRAYVAASGANVTSFWALYDAVRSTARWADCRETEKDISCIVIGSFNVPSFTRPLGQSEAMVARMHGRRRQG